jgi:hypothetical protein
MSSQHDLPGQPRRRHSGPAHLNIWHQLDLDRGIAGGLRRDASNASTPPELVTQGLTTVGCPPVDSTVTEPLESTLTVALMAAARLRRSHEPLEVRVPSSG